MAFMPALTSAIRKTATTRKYGQPATKPAVRKPNTIRGAAAAKLTDAVTAQAPAVPTTTELTAAASAQMNAGALQRRQAFMQAQAQSEFNPTAVQTSVTQGDVPPANQMGALVDPAIAAAAEADRKRKLAALTTRGELRRTILG